MKKFFLITLMALAVSLQSAVANDGVFYVNGNHLIPLEETDISIKKEILTITLCDDGFASVDVQYEMVNNGAPKTVTMGFEATVPYNDGESFNKNCTHPNIKDFSATMNGQLLPLKNGVIQATNEEGAEKDFIPLDLKVWREPRETDPEFEENGADMIHMLYNPSTKEYMRYSYAYYFTANFKQGVNTIHHTYRYEMSNGVGRSFEVPYWLTPAMRWANHQIDDFTLRIKTDNATKHFLVDCNSFNPNGFKVTSGKGKVRTLDATDYRNRMAEVVLRNGTVEYHAVNFVANEDMAINSADQLYEAPDDDILYYDSGETFYPIYVDSWTPSRFGVKDKKGNFAKRLLRNLPYAHRGYVFKDPDLRKVFESQWWYMPDPNFTPTESTFHAHEWRLINENK